MVVACGGVRKASVLQGSHGTLADNEDLQGSALDPQPFQESDEIQIDKLPQLMSKINQAQASYRDRIDDYYIENVELNELMVKQDEKIAWMRVSLVGSVSTWRWLLGVVGVYEMRKILNI